MSSYGWFIPLYLILSASCARIQTSELITVCAQAVDELGYMRGRTLLYNQRGANAALASAWSHKGRCVPTLWQSRRITVCLVCSTECCNDRTTNVWEDQLEWYFELYPGSYRGHCAVERPEGCHTGLGSSPALRDSWREKAIKPRRYYR